MGLAPDAPTYQTPTDEPEKETRMPVLVLAQDPGKNLIPIEVDANGYQKMVSPDATFEVTLSLDTGAYADGDVLADTQELDGAAFLANGRTAILQSVVVYDLDDNAGALDIVLLNADQSLGTENSAVSISDANLTKVVAVVEVAAADYIDFINSQVAVIDNIGALIEAASDDDALYIAAISRDTKTYTASGIKVRVGLLR
jgi:hypothetical protein